MSKDALSPWVTKILMCPPINVVAFLEYQKQRMLKYMAPRKYQEVNSEKTENR